MPQRQLAVSYRRVEELLPYAKNARTHSQAQVQQIVNSMKAFGWTNPILIDEHDTLIAGHGRLLAAQQLKLKKVPYIVLDGLTEEQRRAYVIADNKLATNAGWDLALLASELKGLEVIGFQIDLLGFSKGELKDLIGADAPVRTGLTADDDAPSIGPAVSRAGDIWLCGRHRVMCGDATQLEHVQSLVPSPELVDLMWTDPPYNVNYVGDAGSIANDNLKPEDFEKLLERAFRNACKVMRGGAVAYVSHADTEREVFSRTFAHEFKLAQVLIWVKHSAALSRQDYNWKHEPILYGWKEGGAHYFCGDFSRTTVIAAEKEGLNARLLELEPRYADVIVRRWEDFTGKRATHQASGRPFSEIVRERLTPTPPQRSPEAAGEAAG